MSFLHPSFLIVVALSAVRTIGVVIGFIDFWIFFLLFAARYT